METLLPESSLNSHTCHVLRIMTVAKCILFNLKKMILKLIKVVFIIDNGNKLVPIIFYGISTLPGL